MAVPIKKKKSSLDPPWAKITDFALEDIVVPMEIAGNNKQFKVLFEAK